MDITRAREIVDILRGNGDTALTSVEYAELFDALESDNNTIAERDAEIERLNVENEALRNINTELQLRRGQTIVTKEKETVIENAVDEISDDDIIDAIKEFN